MHRRLERLEARPKPQGCGRGASKRQWERYFHAHENAQRELRGLEPLPDLEYTEEDRQDDLRTIQEHVPAMRADPGWQTDKAQAFLDAWEQDLKEKLYGKEPA